MKKREVKRRFLPMRRKRKKKKNPLKSKVSASLFPVSLPHTNLGILFFRNYKLT